MEEAKHLTTQLRTLYVHSYVHQATERKQNQYTTTYPGPSELITQGKAEPKEKRKQIGKQENEDVCFVYADVCNVYIDINCRHSKITFKN